MWSCYISTIVLSYNVTFTVFSLEFSKFISYKTFFLSLILSFKTVDIDIKRSKTLYIEFILKEKTFRRFRWQVYSCISNVCFIIVFISLLRFVHAFVKKWIFYLYLMLLYWTAGLHARQISLKEFDTGVLLSYLLCTIINKHLSTNASVNKVTSQWDLTLNCEGLGLISGN